MNDTGCSFRRVFIGSVYRAATVRERKGERARYFGSSSSYRRGSDGAPIPLCRNTSVRFLVHLIATICVASAVPPVARAGVFDRYELAGSFELPEGTTTFDALADGRLIVLVGADVYMETGPHDRVFTLHGTLPGADLNAFGPSFVRPSPDGTKIAVGNCGGASFGNFEVGVFDLATVVGTWFAANHTDGRWIDDTRIALTASDFSNGSSVTVLDTLSADPVSPINTVVIDSVGGASGGIAFDAGGNLVTANGLSSIGPSGTGTIKAFRFEEWTAPLAGGDPLNFETDGTFIVDVLGGVSLGFDDHGNLLVGGADAAPDDDAVAIVRAARINAALLGISPVDASDVAQVRRLDPITDNDFNFYAVGYNAPLSEMYVRDFGATTVHVYRDPTRGPGAFATSVVSHEPAPGQFVGDPAFNDPARTLGPPKGGGRQAADNSSIVTLGGFGGSITLGFDHTVVDDPFNRFGMDAIVFGNAFWPGGEPHDHWAEAATIEISLDANVNGLADDAWFLIPGSHIADPAAQLLIATWDDDVDDAAFPPALASWIPPGSTGVWTTRAFELPADLFGSPVVVNPSPDMGVEGIFGYADYSPTLLLGDLDGDDVVDQSATLPDRFYTVPDDSLTVGVTPGSGGGDAFDIAWAVDPETGLPADLPGFDFIRLTTAVDVVTMFFAEKSAEIDAVADAAPDTFGDFDDDRDIDLRDWSAMQLCIGRGGAAAAGCVRLDREPDDVIDLADVAAWTLRVTGPR